MESPVNYVETLAIGDTDQEKERYIMVKRKMRDGCNKLHRLPNTQVKQKPSFNLVQTNM